MRLIRRAVPVVALTGLALVGVPAVAPAQDEPPAPPAPGAGVAPDAVHNLGAAAGFDSVLLTWDAPSAPDWKDVIVRMAVHGTVPPATVSEGFRVHVAPGKAIEAVALGLHPANSYAFSVFAVDTEGLVSAPASVVVQGTTITLGASDNSLVYGQDLVLRGKLSVPGASSSGQAVDVWARRPGNQSEWVYVDYAVTGPGGNFAAPVTPGLSYSYIAVYYGSGDATGMGSQSTTVPVSVAKDVTVSVNRTSGRSGTSFTISTSVWPSPSGKKLTLQRLVDGEWRTVTTGRTSASKATRFTVQPTKRGTYVYRVVAAKGGGLAQGVSKRLTITVT